MASGAWLRRASAERAGEPQKKYWIRSMRSFHSSRRAFVAGGTQSSLLMARKKGMEVRWWLEHVGC